MYEHRALERATLSHGVPESFPDWARAAVEEERKIAHLPESVKKKYRRLRKMREDRREMEHLPEQLRKKLRLMDKLQAETPNLDRLLKQVAGGG